jgi:hypothetical protein
MAKGRVDKTESSRDHLDWAQARGLDAQLHFLTRTERRQLSIRAHGTAEASLNIADAG